MEETCVGWCDGYDSVLEGERSTFCVQMDTVNRMSDEYEDLYCDLTYDPIHKRSAQMVGYASQSRSLLEKNVSLLRSMLEIRSKKRLLGLDLFLEIWRLSR